MKYKNMDRQELNQLHSEQWSLVEKGEWRRLLHLPLVNSDALPEGRTK